MCCSVYSLLLTHVLVMACLYTMRTYLKQIRWYSEIILHDQIFLDRIKHFGDYFSHHVSDTHWCDIAE
jgi:hypothetical protein